VMSRDLLQIGTRKLSAGFVCEDCVFQHAFPEQNANFFD
jgi:hypothetical protein